MSNPDTAIKFLLSPKGRTARMSFNLYYLVTFVLGVVALAIDYMAMGPAIFDKGSYGGTVGNVLQILTIWPGLMVNIRRMHDLDRKGWWLLVGYGAPAIIAVIAGVVAGIMVARGQPIISGYGALSGIFILASIVWMLGFLIIQSCVRGTKGPNRFGEDPLEHQNIVAEGCAL